MGWSACDKYDEGSSNLKRIKAVLRKSSLKVSKNDIDDAFLLYDEDEISEEQFREAILGMINPSKDDGDDSDSLTSNNKKKRKKKKKARFNDSDDDDSDINLDDSDETKSSKSKKSKKKKEIKKEE